MDDWVRGEEIGHGSFATINKAIPRKSSAPLMAVKSSVASSSFSLKNEKQVLSQLGTCPKIIRCFGESFTVGNGQEYYNLLLEYAKKGSIADQMKINGRPLSELEIRRYTRSVLEGLSHIHSKGFVHCDIKIQNILIFENGEAKIADFGLATKTGEKNRAKPGESFEWRGTPLYMSPESMNENEYESPCDIWALGCLIIEMFTGKLPWNCKPDSNLFALMVRIGVGDELPEIPECLTDEGKDFVGKCLVKDPRKRWTAEMLLNHPFVADHQTAVPLNDMKEFCVSPRDPFDFPDWLSVQSLDSNQKTYVFLSPETSPKSDQWVERNQLNSDVLSGNDRLQSMLTHEVPHWSVTDSWVTVR